MAIHHGPYISVESGTYVPPLTPATTSTANNTVDTILKYFGQRRECSFGGRVIITKICRQRMTINCTIDNTQAAARAAEVGRAVYVAEAQRNSVAIPCTPGGVRELHQTELSFV